jgi:glutamate 5-kinase
VSSGAVNAGVNALKLSERPKEIVVQQVMAAVGNPLLMEQYRKYIKFCGIGQVLVTQEDFSNRVSYVNFRNTMDEMIHRHIIPIINENDVVSVNELQSIDGTEYNFTDNDILAGIVAASVDADLLIIFSDIEGLYSKHPNSPNAEFIAYVPEINEKIMHMGKKGSKFGRGGMISKLTAANIVTKAGGAVIIAHAKKTRLKELLQGNSIATFFTPVLEPLKDREVWMIFGANLKGKISIDEGAKQAIMKGASLLFSGIKDFTGNFNRGDIVGIVVETYEEETKDIHEEMIVRGKINFSMEELTRIKNMNKEVRIEYFSQNNIREIISHEYMAFTHI